MSSFDLASLCHVYTWRLNVWHTLIARFMGQNGANMGLAGPRWAACLPHELCYLGKHVATFSLKVRVGYAVIITRFTVHIFFHFVYVFLNPHPGTWGLFLPERMYFPLPAVIETFHYSNILCIHHIKVTAKKNVNVVLEKKNSNWPYLNRAPLPSSEDPVVMVTESFRWEAAILKWQ